MSTSYDGTGVAIQGAPKRVPFDKNRAFASHEEGMRLHSEGEY